MRDALSLAPRWLRGVMDRPAVLSCMLLGLALAQEVRAQPAGGYQQSCRESSVQGNVLRSSCKDRGGNFRSTALVDFAQCVGDIFNDDGVLRCSRGAPAPPGSYTASCEQIRVEGKDLLANCRSRRGNLIGARLSDWRQCTSQIANNDGMLQCQRANAMPAGSYRATCDEVVVDGADLRANCLDGPSRRVRSTLVSFAACTSEIFNQNGQLRCSHGGLPPSGSYTRSCNMAWRDGDSLNAVCNDADGRARQTSIDAISACRSEISNSNGRLTCVKGTGNLPPGDYASSCKDIVVEPTRLSAACRSRNFVDRQTSLDNLGECRTMIENIDGFLSCVKGAGPVPRGSYRDTCHGVVVNGSAMTAQCRRGDGTYGLTTLDTNGCPPPGVSNENGILTCKGSSPPPSAPTVPAIQLVCAGATIPAGWIVNDISTDILRCGGAKNDVWSIVRFDNLSVNAALTVCASSPTPTGWSEVDFVTDFAKCGNTGTAKDNVKEIRRLN